MKIIIMIILRLTSKNHYFTIYGSLEKTCFKNIKSSNIILGL